MYQKKCVYLHPKIDKRNVEQCGKHLYCPKLKFRQIISRGQDTDAFCFFEYVLAYRLCVSLSIG